MEPTQKELHQIHLNMQIKLAFLDVMDGVSSTQLQEITRLPICRCEDIKDLHLSLIQKTTLTKS